MILWWLLIRTLSVASDSATVCFEDAVTRAPVVAVQLTPMQPLAVQTPAVPTPAVQAARGTTTSSTIEATLRRLTHPCAIVPDGRWLVRRIGYREQQLTVSSADSTALVSLQPIVVRSTALDTVRVRESRSSRASSITSHMSATVRASDAQARGAASTADIIEQLPLTTMTAARGETGLSLRGARREQTAITLDGLSLNDPATGVADVGDLPLSAVGSATVTLGADPLGAGPGANGGVLALTSAAANQVTLRGAAFGSATFDASASLAGAGAIWHGAILRRVAANDFSFVNDAGEQAQRESRINNDESRLSLLLGAIATHGQFAALVSHTDRGMVGPANVRTYDADRAHTDRMLLRAQTAWRSALVVTGLRTLNLAYRDPSRPALNADATVHAFDVDVQGRVPTPLAALTWRVGGGTDNVIASGGVRQSRARAFASTVGTWQFGRANAEAGLRIDAAQHTSSIPSLSVAIEEPLSSWLTIGARLAQSMRMPTLYDLYFSSPQRLIVRALDPERVRLDAELTLRVHQRTVLGDASAQISVVKRDTDHAIVWFPGNFGWSPANVGREALRGVEASGSLRAAHQELSAWTSFYDSMLHSNALAIPTPYTPRVALGAQSVSTWHAGALTVRGKFTGRRPYSAGPRNPAFELPAVTLVDIALTHPVPRSLLPRRWTPTLTWSLENATNVAWQSVRGFPSPGRAWAISLTLHDSSPQ